MTQKNYYEILGVDKNVSDDDLKRAYKKLAIKFHPDKNPNNKEAEERFKEINEAYSVLSDPQKRQQYDTFGTVGDMGGGMHINPEDIFKNFFRNSGFGFGFDDEPMERTYKGSDKVLKVNVSLKDIYNNVNKTITYTVKRPCPKCNGSGSKSGKIEECPHCNGTGRVRERRQNGMIFMENITNCGYCNGTGKVVKDVCPNCMGSGLIDTKETISITVPTLDKVLMQTYKRSGGGHSCQNGLGINGDLLFTFNVSIEDGYDIDRSKPMDIIRTIDVPLIDCLLGTTLKVKHFDDKSYSVTIKECTKDGQMYRIRGKGFKFVNQIGDLYIKVNMVTPNSLTAEDKKLLNNLKKSKTFK